MSMLDKRVLELGNKFRGRLDKLWLDIALDYVDHNEVPLALETLCDYIVEFDLPISTEEYDEIIRLVRDMDIYEDRRFGYEYLKELILA